MPNSDEVKGRVKAIKGRVKEAVAEAAGDERAADEGRAEQVAGNAREAVGTIKRKVADAGETLKDKARSTANAVSRGAESRRRRAAR